MTDYEMLREMPLAARTTGVAAAQREAWRISNEEQRELTDSEFWQIALKHATEFGMGASPSGA